MNRLDHLPSVKLSRRSLTAGVAVASAFGAFPLTAARAEDYRSDLIEDGRRALYRLEATDPRANFLARRALAVLIFPNVLKAGLIFGGETGNGVAFIRGRTEGFYNMSGGTWGLQIGGQDFSYAVFFMTQRSIHYLHQVGGFGLGSIPSIVVVDVGAGVAVDTTTALRDVYAFPFNQKGLMANLTVEGTKITQIYPDRP
jgi:lipid-binding SYLF domain-containing protein